MASNFMIQPKKVALIVSCKQLQLQAKIKPVYYPE